MEPWKLNLQTSDFDFQREVLPNVSASLPAGEVVSVETEGVITQTSTTGTAAVLDQDAGIDLLIRTSSGVTTVAARVSYWSTPAYATFTVGERELEKRRRELANEEAIGPYFTVQGTVTERQTGTFVYGAVVATRELVTFIDSFPDLVEERRNSISGKRFKVVWAKFLLEQGFRVDVYVAPNAVPILGWP